MPMKEEKEGSEDTKTEDTVMIEKIVNSTIHGEFAYLTANLESVIWEAVTTTDIQVNIVINGENKENVTEEIDANSCIPIKLSRRVF